MPPRPALDGTYIWVNRRIFGLAMSRGYCHGVSMLTELYIEALLVDEGLAYEVWELWEQGLISDELAVWAW